MSTDVVATKVSAQDRRNQYNRVVRIARLLSLLLSSVDFNVNRELLRTEQGAKKLGFKGDISSFSYDADEGYCVIGCSWTVELKAGRRKIGKCVATYEVIFDEIKGFDHDVIKIFAEHMGKSSTYSYFRSLFASLDWASDLNTPPLPIFKSFPNV